MIEKHFQQTYVNYMIYEESNNQNPRNTNNFYGVIMKNLLKAI